MISSSKKWSITLPAVLALCLLFLGMFWGSPATGAMQTLVWEDNFNDGTYEPEWTVSGGSFSAAILRMESGADVWNYASRTSANDEGEWHFTVCIDSTPGACVAFMATSLGGVGLSYPSTGYVVTFNPVDGWIRLYKHENSIRSNLGSYSVTILMGTVFDVKVTRNSTGNFDVYIDDTLRISAQSTHIDTSSYFAIRFCEGGYIDNIKVYETHDNGIHNGDGVTPLPVELIVLAGGLVAVIVIVVVVIIVVRRRRSEP
ncbi:MAG: hypothetical protein ACFE9D_01965 [Promethearchaeota archaeon]